PNVDGEVQTPIEPAPESVPSDVVGDPVPAPDGESVASPEGESVASPEGEPLPTEAGGEPLPTEPGGEGVSTGTDDSTIEVGSLDDSAASSPAQPAPAWQSRLDK